MISLFYILDEDWNPRAVDDATTWGAWIQAEEEKAKRGEPNRKRVALDVIGKTRVSTVFLGSDHGYGEGAPVLFETMVFEDGGAEDQIRYSSIRQARAGHVAMLHRVLSGRRDVVDCPGCRGEVFAFEGRIVAHLDGEDFCAEGGKQIVRTLRAIEEGSDA